MNKLTIPLVLLLTALTSGCYSVKYQGLDAPAYIDSFPDNRKLSFSLNLDNAQYMATFDQRQFEAHLKEALLSAGFSNVVNGKPTSGYAIEATLHHDRSTNWGDFALSFITLSVYPSSGDNAISFDITYYKDGEVIRSATYQGNYVDYSSSYFPTPLFVGNNSNDFMRLLANDLAENIAKDCPTDNNFSYNAPNLAPLSTN